MFGLLFLVPFFFLFLFLRAVKNPFSDSVIIMKFLCVGVILLSTGDERAGFTLFLAHSLVKEIDI